MQETIEWREGWIYEVHTVPAVKRDQQRNNRVEVSAALMLTGVVSKANQIAEAASQIAETKQQEM